MLNVNFDFECYKGWRVRKRQLIFMKNSGYLVFYKDWFGNFSILTHKTNDKNIPLPQLLIKAKNQTQLTHVANVKMLIIRLSKLRIKQVEENCLPTEKAKMMKSFMLIQKKLQIWCLTLKIDFLLYWENHCWT